MKDKVLLSGSLIAAIAASLCCIGPLLAIVLGVGTFSAATAFASFRPYLLGLTALLLAGAFYLTYRKREVECRDGACNVRGASRASKIMLWLATVAVIAFAAFPYFSGALLGDSTRMNTSTANSDFSEAGASSDETRAVFSVTGMTCDSCAVRIQQALAKKPGVKSADVSYEKGQAVVIYSSSSTNKEALKAAIDSTGYEANEATSDTPDTSGSTITTALIGIEGMTCGSCATTVRLALNKINGVKFVEVSFQDKVAKVSYDSATVSPEQLEMTIRKAGFKPIEVKPLS